jgi:hypothetical protein
MIFKIPISTPQKTHCYSNTILFKDIVTSRSENHAVKKGKLIPVTACGGPKSCETSRLPYFLDNRLTDGGEVVSLTRRTPFIASVT